MVLFDMAHCEIWNSELTNTQGMIVSQPKQDKRPLKRNHLRFLTSASIKHQQISFRINYSYEKTLFFVLIHQEENNSKKIIEDKK